VGNQSELRLGYKNRKHAAVELSDKSKRLGYKNPEHAIVDLYDENGLWLNKPS